MKNLLEVIDLYDDDTPGMADGGRIGFKDSKMPIKQALKEIVEEKGTNFKNQQQLSDLVEEKVGYKPNPKVLRPSKYSILEGITYDSTSKPFTDKQLKDILGDDLRKFRAQNLSDRQIRDLASSRKQYQNLSDEKKALKRERNKINLKKRIEKMSPEELESVREKAAIRTQEKRGTRPKYHKVQTAKSLLWNDLIRAASIEDGYLKFKNFTPKKGKYYNKAETEKIILVDKNGNEFKFNSLKEDISKYSGLKSEDVFRPYAQREFLSKEGLTKEINKFYGIQPGSRQSVFNVQHVQGIKNNPFNVQLTFADQNISEAGAKRTFDSDFKSADTLSKKKLAVKKFYANLGKDIPTQIGKVEKGSRRSLPYLLEKTVKEKKVPISSEVMSKVGALEQDILKKYAVIGCGPKAARTGGRINFDAGSSVACIRKGMEKIKSGSNLTNADKLNINKINNIAKTSRGAKAITSAAKFAIGPLGIPLEIAVGGFFAATDFATGANKDEIISNLTFGLGGKSMEEQLKAANPMYGKADKLTETYDGYLSTLNKLGDFRDPNNLRPGKKITEADVEKTMQPFLRVNPQRATGDFFDLDMYKTSAKKDREAEADFAEDKLERALERGFYQPGIGGSQRISEFQAAGGGIAKLAGIDSGPPPESGPNSQGLQGLMKRVKNK